MTAAPGGGNRFAGFLGDLERLVRDCGDDEPMLLGEGARLLRQLLRDEDWLPGDLKAAPATYAQNLLFCDAGDRFCVVAFVWGPGQGLPAHDHTVWGLIGVLRGAEDTTRYRLGSGDALVAGEKRRLEQGEVDIVSPRTGDIHAVWNALPDDVSISIHVYGGNIGMINRHIYRDRLPREIFSSGYTNDRMPNWWAK
jgi:predicted metal-dependent enzyme (double-stranded beta helix superfamily)